MRQLNVLRETIVYKTLFLTGNEVSPKDLEACHRLKKKRKCNYQIQKREIKVSGYKQQEINEQQI